MEPVFTGRSALVIGGTGGIGRPVALGLAERGASVTVTGGSSGERLDSVMAELQAAGRKAPVEKACAGEKAPSKKTSPVEKTPFSAPLPAMTGFLCRIGQDGLSPEKAVRFILDRAPPPDILVIAWGPFKRETLEAGTAESWRFLVENNLIFPGIMISSVLCDMIKKGWGRILLFGGTNTGEIRGFTTTAAYSAAKTALGVVAKSAALSAGNAGITCNALCPGLTGTEYTTAEERLYNRKKSPRPVRPEEAAAAALGLLENSALNGVILPVDRGIRV